MTLTWQEGFDFQLITKSYFKKPNLSGAVILYHVYCSFISHVVKLTCHEMRHTRNLRKKNLILTVYKKHSLSLDKLHIYCILQPSFKILHILNSSFDLWSTILSGNHQAATRGTEEHRRGGKSLHVFHRLAQYNSEKLHGVNGYLWTSGPGRNGEKDEKARGIDPFTKIYTVFTLGSAQYVKVSQSQCSASISQWGIWINGAMLRFIHVPEQVAVNQHTVITRVKWWVSKTPVHGGEVAHKPIWVQYPSQQKMSRLNLVFCQATYGICL